MRPICPPVYLGLALLLGGCLSQEGDIQTLQPVQEDSLKAGDALVITVAGETELSGAFSVDDDGTVRMELLGAVPAVGWSVAGFQGQLRQLLLAGYLKNPQVRVERASQFALTPPMLRPSQ